MSYLNNIKDTVPDAIFSIREKAAKDKSKNKQDLSIGVYYNKDGKVDVLDIVKKVDKLLANDNNLNYTYSPTNGYPLYNKYTRMLIYGNCKNLDKISIAQTPGGTGGLRVGFEFLRTIVNKNIKVYVSDPTYANHKNIIRSAGFTNNRIKEYPYWDRKKRCYRFNDMVNFLKKIPSGSIVLYQMCGHNPTGTDPSREEWKVIAKITKKKKFIAVFDAAYQGFISGDYVKDAYPLRLFNKFNISLLVGQSYSKNFGLYGERVGSCSIVCRTLKEKHLVDDHLKYIIRPLINSAPIMGARIIHKILSSNIYKKKWNKELHRMAGRLRDVRQKLYNLLDNMDNNVDWSYIKNGHGLYVYTEFPLKLTKELANKYHIYILYSGRINIAAISEKNINYIAESINKAVKKYPNYK